MLFQSGVLSKHDILKAFLLGTSYVCATGGALVTAIGLNSLVKHAPPLIGRFVPFCAVAAANCVNIPLMRQLELKNGNDEVVFTTFLC